MKKNIPTQRNKITHDFLPCEKQEHKGFTLIELLVVIAIIGLLSSVVLASLNSARARGRDARRISDLQQVQFALELYASSNNGKYPITSAADPDGIYYSQCSGNHTLTGSTGYVPDLAPTYIPALPKEPLSPVLPGYDCYRYISNGNSYMIMAGTAETYTAAKNPSPRLVQPAGNFAKYSPDAINSTIIPGSW